VNFSELQKEESFENIIEKLIYAKFQLFNTFLTFVQDKYQYFSGNRLSELKKILNLCMQFHIPKQAKHVHAKFQLFSLYSDGLRQIYGHF
jgi:translation initiation factor 2 alpha subunit (eIF-2alpha)